jgi:uncharacterized coiled-coil protein SlyX
MSRPMAIVLGLVAVLALVGTAVFYQKYRTTHDNYSALQLTEQEARTRYGQAIDEIAAIQDSLNAIVLGDSAVKLMPGDRSERRLTQSQADEALARIGELKAGIERARDRIDQLEGRLKQAGVRTAGLQRMIANLRSSVAAKEEQVVFLTSRVDTLQTQVSGLTATVEVKTDSIVTQVAQLEDRRRELGTVYYVIGNKRDLRESGLVVASGGVLGMGKTLEPSGQLDNSLFTPIDTDEVTVIRIPADKAEILSAQPTGSYTLQPMGDQVELRITDPLKFRTVKHLIIMTS